MFPRRYDTRIDSSSPYTISSPSQTLPDYASPTTISSHGHHMSASPRHSSTLPGVILNAQSEARWGISPSGWPVRSLAESGQADASGTANRLISHTVPEVPGNQAVIPNRSDTPRRTWRIVPLPSQMERDRVPRIVLNPSLLCEGYRNGRRAMSPIDIATVSATAILQLATNTATFRQWATSPPLPSINLVHPALPWSITVHANVTYVTVCDVLWAICQSLQLPLREEYWSYTAGLDRGDRGTPEQSGRNLKRFHLLQGRTEFAGLTRTAAEVRLGEDIWRMNFH
ncbi:hypothetical protein FB446DRAFT_718918 [Lentinula raphanica]|nr:hypothetical protein C8R42DRAFT_251538 [Lentinula raphanica]KAJ3777171.1 hypothetical protein FB446DRAFT_718918 [Lentinula raphanica]